MTARMGREWYVVFEYDFNVGHGEVVIHKTLAPELSIGQQIMLVTIDGNRRADDYEGFGTIVKITGIQQAANSNYMRVSTDLRTVYANEDEVREVGKRIAQRDAGLLDRLAED